MRIKCLCRTQTRSVFALAYAIHVARRAWGVTRPIIRMGARFLVPADEVGRRGLGSH